MIEQHFYLFKKDKDLKEKHGLKSKVSQAVQKERVVESAFHKAHNSLT